jgi:hypothetical protein
MPCARPHPHSFTRVLRAPLPCLPHLATNTVCTLLPRLSSCAQARDRVVQGLLECLRLTPPRMPEHQPSHVRERLWSAAKSYWAQPGADAALAQQQLQAAMARARAGGEGPGAAAEGRRVATSTTSKPAELRHGAVRPAAPLPPVPTSAGRGREAPALGPLLVSLQAAGLPLSRADLAAVQTLLHARAADQARQRSFVSALWALSVVGGPLFFSEELQALTQVRQHYLHMRWSILAAMAGSAVMQAAL